MTKAKEEKEAAEKKNKELEADLANKNELIKKLENNVKPKPQPPKGYWKNVRVNGRIVRTWVKSK